MHIMVYNILFCMAGILTGYFIPNYAYRFASYKCWRSGKEMQQEQWPMYFRTISAFICSLLFLAAIHLMPLKLAILTSLLGVIAVFGFFVDSAIRIIANEMLLIMLLIGLSYRFLAGGVSSLLGSLGAMLLVILIFGAAAGFTYLKKGNGGVGMGDIKLAMVIAITVGYPGVLHFLIGLAFAVSIYCVVGLLSRRLLFGSLFPMCGHIMAGLLFALFRPYVPFFPA